MTSTSRRAPKPSQITDKPYVRVEMADSPPCDDDFVGKWQIFLDREHVDEAWAKVVALVLAGELGPSAKVSTARQNRNGIGGPNKHVMVVYAKDWRDLPDLRRILRRLREVGLGQRWVHFKRDRETLTGAYTVRGRMGVSVWNAPPGVDEITTKWVTGTRLTVTDENEAVVVDAITSKDAPPPFCGRDEPVRHCYWNALPYPPPPPWVGLSQIAQRLSLPYETVLEWAAYGDDFPSPGQVPDYGSNSGEWWQWPIVERWARERGLL